jgi:hypothetical protein
LSELRLQNATFAGTAPATLPATWSTLDNLTTLVLSNVTGVSGTIPRSWATGMRRLSTLHLRAVPGLNITRANLEDLLGAVNVSTGNSTAGNSSVGNSTRVLASLALDGFYISGPLPALGDK